MMQLLLALICAFACERFRLPCTFGLTNHVVGIPRSLLQELLNVSNSKTRVFLDLIAG